MQIERNTRQKYREKRRRRETNRYREQQAKEQHALG